VASLSAPKRPLPVRADFIGRFSARMHQDGADRSRGFPRVARRTLPLAFESTPLS
jgi:hypothetical protein